MNERRQNLDQLIAENISNTILIHDRSVLLDIELDIRKSISNYEKAPTRNNNNGIIYKLITFIRPRNQ